MTSLVSTNTRLALGLLGLWLVLTTARLSGGQTNQRLWAAVLTISSDPAPKLTRTTLAPASYCQVLKLIEDNPQYDQLHLYNRPNPFRMQQVCQGGDVEFMLPRFPTDLPSKSYSNSPAYGNPAPDNTNNNPYYTPSTKQQSNSNPPAQGKPESNNNNNSPNPLQQPNPFNNPPFGGINSGPWPSFGG